MLNVTMTEELNAILKQIVRKPKCRYFFSAERVHELSKNAYYAKNDVQINGKHVQLIEIKDFEDKSIVLKFSATKETILNTKIHEGMIQGYELISITLGDNEKIKPKFDSHELIVVM